MTVQSNTAFFRADANFGLPRPASIRAMSLINPETEAVQDGVLLGSATRAVGLNGRFTDFQVARPHSLVVWTLDQTQPEFVTIGGERFLQSGSIHTVNRRHFITTYQNDNKCLVHVQTGMFGRPDMAKLAEHLKTGGVFAHGSYALDSGAALSVGGNESSEDVPEHNIGEAATRIRWRVGRNKMDGVDIPFRREDLWLVPKGTGLLVGSVFGGDVCRLMNESGTIIKVDAPRGRERFDELEAARIEKNLAAKLLRDKKKVTVEDVPEAQTIIAEEGPPPPAAAAKKRWF